MKRIGCFLFLLIFLGCEKPTVSSLRESEEEEDDRLARVSNLLKELLYQMPEEQILIIPTYEGSGQAVHPDILFAGDTPLPHRFYLAMTPFPFSKNRFENPSILVSENGLDFIEERPGLNPLVPAPPTDHNSDPDLVYDAERRQLLLYYLESGRPLYNDVVLLESADGLHWQKQIVWHSDLQAGDDFIVSPAVIKAEGRFFMFFANLSASGYPIQFLTSPDGLHWDPSSARSAVAALPDGRLPWHVDVFRGDRTYFMLCCGPFGDSALYLATSSDLEEWQFLQQPILKPSPRFYDTQWIYRSSGLVSGDLLVVWFSFKNSAGRWGIGAKKFSLQQLFAQGLKR